MWNSLTVGIINWNDYVSIKWININNWIHDSKINNANWTSKV